jgi:SPP1 family predicted phage head-tail adaptor
MKIGSKVTNPGEIRTRVTLKSRTVTVGTGGFQTPTLTTLATVSAKWVNVHGSEVWAANAVNAMRAATVTIRYRDDIDETCVVVLDGENYEITSMDDIQQRHEYIEMKVQLFKSG